MNDYLHFVQGYFYHYYISFFIHSLYGYFLNDCLSVKLSSSYYYSFKLNRIFQLLIQIIKIIIPLLLYHQIKQNIPVARRNSITNILDLIIQFIILPIITSLNLSMFRHHIKSIGSLLTKNLFYRAASKTKRDPYCNFLTY